MRNFEDLKIAVAGTGYVGLSISTLLAYYLEDGTKLNLSDKDQKLQGLGDCPTKTKENEWR